MQEGSCANYEYVSVYLLDSPYAIDTSYDYFVPIDMRCKIQRGAFVTVPFGRTNRKQMGIVWELMSISAYKNPKSIIDICADRAPLSDEMLGLCAYMKTQLLCTMGDAVRCVVPAAALGKLTEYYSPTEHTAPDASAGFTPADLFVYDYIVSKGTVSLDMLKGRFGGVAASETVEKLLLKGIIQKNLESGRVAGEIYESFYSLDKAALESAKITSQKQKIIIDILSDGKERTIDEILSESNTSDAPVKTLIQKGVVIKRRERRYRELVAGETSTPVNYILNSEQRAAADRICEHISSRQPKAVLLHGVTGSGKTSVIVTAIDKAIDEGRGVIILLPEIALTPQTLNIFRSRYGHRVSLVHSGLSAGERADAYSKIKSGEADIVIGTRSAVFSPVKNLGLIIIDEEHEATYKSESSPKYHARDIARYRCAYNGAVMLLSSATPSLESYSKALEGKYELLKLTQRYGEATLPEVKIYDMRREARTGNTSPLGSELIQRLKDVISRGEQAVLFLNRRGYNTAVSCRSCGEAVVCPHCSVSMSYHAERGDHERGFLFCHWCGTKMRMPESCPSCGSEHLARVGFGTQRIEKELSLLIPEARILRLDADSTSGKNSSRELLDSFRRGEADILLGTQMVTKGHDFPNVTLVGVLLADMSLYLDDYHANERTFSMLAQVIGRAGRSEKNGVAVIQTNNPDNNTIKLACAQNYEEFYKSEIRLRKLLTFPPYCDIAVLTVVSGDEKQALLISTKLSTEIKRLTDNDYADVPLEVFGPFEAPVYKVEEKYRLRMIIKCRLTKKSRLLFEELMRSFSKEGKDKTILSVDFNPTGL